MFRIIINCNNTLFYLRTFVSAIIVIILFFAGNIFAAHPLITDDTGTQGKGKIQIEINGEYGTDKEDEVTVKTTGIAAAFTYGLIDKLDLIAGLPYQSISIEEGGETTKEKGISDASFAAKWRFFEIDKFSFALKPGVSLPTGDHEKGLGSGKIGYTGFFINTINIQPLVFHINLGYMRNENKLEQEKNLWHVSAACEYYILKNLRIIANIGMEKNASPDADDDPAFLIGGIIYSVKDNFDVDAGIKYGLNKPEVDYTFMAGITFRI